jgi:hypothetical protein
MPVELVPGGIRVQAVLQGDSALPEDRYVSTFHFADTGGGPTVEADLTAAILKVTDFYMTAHATSSAIMDWIAQTVLNGSLCEFRAYDLSVGEPREPVIVPWGGIFDQGGTPLPSELAVCCSFYSLINAPSSRGRVYVGPFTSAALATDTSGPAKVKVAVRSAINDAARAMALDATGPIWSILTHPGGGLPVLKTVTNGWCDDAWDIQRRRGEAATIRDVWTV